jgi:hypothetical protein
VKSIFTNFFKTHYTLGSSRVTLSRIGGSTSKSNKYFTKCLTQTKVLKA